jgi:hypothetical protein
MYHHTNNALNTESPGCIFRVNAPWHFPCQHTPPPCTHHGFLRKDLVQLLLGVPQVIKVVELRGLQDRQGTQAVRVPVTVLSAGLSTDRGSLTQVVVRSIPTRVKPVLWQPTTLAASAVLCLP